MPALISVEGAWDAIASPIKIFLDKIVSIWANLIRFGQNFGKINVKFGKIWSDLGKIKTLHLQKHSISYGNLGKSD